MRHFGFRCCRCCSGVLIAWPDCVSFCLRSLSRLLPPAIHRGLLWPVGEVVTACVPLYHLTMSAASVRHSVPISVCPLSHLYQPMFDTSKLCPRSNLYQLVFDTSKLCPRSNLYQLVFANTKLCPLSTLYQLVFATTKVCSLSNLYQLMFATTKNFALFQLFTS